MPRLPDVRTPGLSATVTHWVRPPRLCGTCSLTCCRCLPCLLTNEAALTPAANPPSDPSLHHSASLDFQGHSNPEPGRSAHPAAPALRCSPRQRAGTDCIRSVRPAKQRCQWQAASPIGFGSKKPLTIAGPGRRACGPYVVQRTGSGNVSAADEAGCLRPPEPLACPKRARWAGRTGGLTVTDGLIKMRVDLRWNWSDPNPRVVRAEVCPERKEGLM